MVTRFPPNAEYFDVHCLVIAGIVIITIMIIIITM